MASNYVLCEGDRESRFEDPREAGAAFYHADKTKEPYVYQENSDEPLDGARFIATTQVVDDGGEKDYERKVNHSHALHGVAFDGDTQFREGYFEALAKTVAKRVEDSGEEPLSQDMLDDMEELAQEKFRRPEAGKNVPTSSIELVDEDFDLDEVRSRAAANRHRDAVPASNEREQADEKRPLPVAGDSDASSNKRDGASIEEVAVDSSWRDRYDEHKKAKKTEYKFKGTDELAFSHGKKRIDVATASPQVAEDIVALASELGWKKIKVNGDDDFRHDVWAAATKAGIEVDGYNPNDDSRIGNNKDQGLPDKRDSQSEKAAPAGAGNPVPRASSDADAKNPVADFARAKASKGVGEGAPSSGDEKAALDTPVDLSVHSGKLVAHGAAPYQHKPENGESYYADIEEPSGHVKTVWGKQIGQAMEDCGANAGDHLELRNKGKTPVEIDVPKFNTEGDRTGFRKETRMRNEWAAEIKDPPKDSHDDKQKQQSSYARASRPKT